MDKQVSTVDGVAWVVRCGAPSWRRSGEDDLRVGESDHIGFEALLATGMALVLLVLTPVIVQSSWRPAALAVPVVLAAVWFLYWARWPVTVVRDDQVVHRASVQGRAHAGRMVREFAAEIARSTDDSLRA